MCPTGSTLQITRRDCRPRWTISPLPLNAERRLPRSMVLVATATIRVVATEGQIYGRQLQQAGDYTGPHRDRLSPNDAWRLAVLSPIPHLSRRLALDRPVDGGAGDAEQVSKFCCRVLARAMQGNQVGLLAG